MRADRVVAAAWVEGGFTITGVLGYRTVLFTLYADGRFITTGDVDAHDVTTYRMARLAPREARAFRLSLMRATSGVDFGDVPVADVGYTRTRVRADGKATWARINALGMDAGLRTDQRQARQRLQALIDQVTARPSRAFEPSAYEIQRMTTDGPQQQLEWPGPTLPDGKCGSISARTYGEFPDSFRQGSAYTWQGEGFTLWVRPLAPGETACRRIRA